MMVKAPIPEWILQNKALMHYMELFPILIMYIVPSLMLGGLIFFAVQESMFATDKFPVKGKVRQ